MKTIFFSFLEQTFEDSSLLGLHDTLRTHKHVMCRAGVSASEKEMFINKMSDLCPFKCNEMKKVCLVRFFVSFFFLIIRNLICYRQTFSVSKCSVRGVEMVENVIYSALYEQ